MENLLFFGKYEPLDTETLRHWNKIIVNIMVKIKFVNQLKPLKINSKEFIRWERGIDMIFLVNLNPRKLKPWEIEQNYC